MPPYMNGCTIVGSEVLVAASCHMNARGTVGGVEKGFTPIVIA